ncbi:uroporphyrinogen-III synthase [Roseovarius azorensis]|uniref:Uroporphyrinogen-III synthase n=1 Tax=Roseovarius azorensis TaxID=1287727 RepID=A0A1H7R0Q0_9RHOB|nr:uroporphyrinogen-III synthase [Roseovarius azorensis]SEL53147.1 uroporphyrinogen-III synthase [Roseovarius azorensis]
MTVTILITRPEPEASRFADQVRASLGDAVTILCAPVMRIAYRGVLPDLSGNEVLIFTSRHGVAGFCRLTDRRDLACYAVGDATAVAAQEAGLRAVSAGGDAGALLARIADDGCSGPFLHLRGAHVAADIVGALRRAGHVAQDAVVYDQIATDLNRVARDCLVGAGPVILPLMSPRSARLFFEQARAATAPLLVAAISRKVAEMVPEGVALAVQTAKTPDAEGILDVLHGLVERAKRLEGGKHAQ